LENVLLLLLLRELVVERLGLVDDQVRVAGARR
jgi:hypothetical protein